MTTENQTTNIAEGELLWTPPQALIDSANISDFIQWLGREKNISVSDYDQLWDWSVKDISAFWAALWDYFDIITDEPFKQVVAGDDMLNSRWFEGSKTNYTEHLLRYEAKASEGETVFCHSSETRPVAHMSWQELGQKVRALATRLREMGVVPGDRVMSYMPNTPETAIAMMAATAIGAIWSSAAQEFGSKTVTDRFGQIEPKIMFVADGYSFNGRVFDRQQEIQTIVDALPSLEQILWLDYMGLERKLETGVPISELPELINSETVARESFRFERVAWDHPLWVLYSSGTTGIPKAIVHSHAGMIAEHYKAMAFHFNLGPQKRMFFYSTPGWMMWNTVISVLLTGCSAVLYDGSPVFGGVDALWRMTAETKSTLFGASPTLVHNMKAAGVIPSELYDLSALDSVVLGGAPSTPETFQWFYDCVKSDLWVSSQSGGTDMCCGIVGGVPLLPTYAAEIQRRMLGIDIQIWSDGGDILNNETGELIITQAFPAAPIKLWGDDQRTRYFDSYYSTFDGVWRHGDLAKINQRGGVYIYGRSDSTLNRFGVRIGTAEIYHVLDTIPEVADSLVICCETVDDSFYMPLFIELKDDAVLTDKLQKAIVTQLRKDASPRHVPDEILQVPLVPYTLTLKKMEVPIRKIVMGAEPDSVAKSDTLQKPEALSWFVDFAQRDEIKAKFQQ